MEKPIDRKLKIARNISLAIILLVVLVAILSFVFPSFKIGLNKFLTNSSFANVLTNNANIQAEAMAHRLTCNATTYGNDIAVFTKEYESGSGTGWSEHNYKILLSADMLAAAKNGRLNIYASAEIRVGYVGGARAQGQIEVYRSNDTKFGSVPQWETAKNYSGSKYATGSGTWSIPTDVGSYISIRMRNSTNKGSADHYTTKMYVKISVASSATYSSSVSGETGGYVDEKIAGVSFTATSNAGIKSAVLEKQVPGAIWADIGSETIYNSNVASTTCDSATSKTLKLSGSYPFGTKFRLRFTNNLREKPYYSKEITFRAKFTVSTDSAELTDFGLNTVNTHTSTTTQYWEYNSGDPNLYITTKLPSDGYYIKDVSSSNYYVSTGLLSGHLPSGSSSSHITFTITKNARKNDRTYANCNLSLKINVDQITPQGSSKVYNGISGSDPGSWYSQRNALITATQATGPAPDGNGYTHEVTKVGSDPRFMTDVGKWGYTLTMKLGAIVLGKIIVPSTHTAAFEVTPRDITSAILISINSCEKVYDNSVTATATTTQTLTTGNTASNPNSIHSGDGANITLGSSTYETKNVGDNLLVTYVFELTFTNADRAKNYKASLSTGAIATVLVESNNITRATTTGNKITPKPFAANAITVTIANKIYDNTTAATVTDLKVTTPYASASNDDGLVLSSYDTSVISAVFASKDVADAINVSITNIKLTFSNATLASNYTLNGKALTADQSATASANITKRVLRLVVTNLSNSIEKEYDATTSIPTGAISFGFETGYGPVGGDIGNITVKTNVFNASYTDANAGEYKNVTVSTSPNPNNTTAALDSTNASIYKLSNYSIIAEMSKTGIGKITQKEIAMSISVTDSIAKTFDWNTSTTGVNISVTLSNVLTPDLGIVTYSPSVINNAVFSTYSSGANTITSTMAITGTGISNYKLPANKSLSCVANIGKKSLNHSSISLIFSPTLEATYVYNALEHTPTLAIRDSEKNTAGLGEYLASTDFSISYADNINASTATSKAKITVAALNTHFRQDENIVRTFSIQKAEISITASNISLVYGTAIQNSSISGTASHKTFTGYAGPAIEGDWSFVGGIATNYPKVSDSGNKDVQFTIKNTTSNPDMLLNFVQPASIVITLAVSPRPISVQISDKTQVFGEKLTSITHSSDNTSYSLSDPANEYATGLVGNDNVEIILKTTAKDLSSNGLYNKQNVGTYPIVIDYPESSTGSTYILNHNYLIVKSDVTNGTYTITKRIISITPNTGNTSTTKTKVYGDPDPAEFEIKVEIFDSNTTTGSPVISEAPLQGRIERNNKANENIGSYTFNQGTLDNLEGRNPNYDIRFNASGLFTITRRILKLRIENAQQEFGDSELSPSVVIDEGFLRTGDTLNGEIIRVKETNEDTATLDKNVGVYILKNKSITTANNNNYEILQVTNGRYTIIKRPITITPSYTVEGADNIYITTSVYGSPVADITNYSIIHSLNSGKVGVPSFDEITGRLVTSANGFDVGLYNISLSNHLVDARGHVASENYDMSINSLKSVKYKVNKRPINLYPKRVLIDYGETPPDKNLLSFEKPDGIVGSDQIAGALSLDYEKINGSIPTTVGSYSITVNESYVAQANPKYSITYDGANKFVISQLEAHIQPTFGQSITYGESVPNISFVAWTKSGKQIDRQNLVGSLELEYTGSFIVPGSYEIKQGSLNNEGSNPNPNYTIVFNSKFEGDQTISLEPISFTVHKKAITITPDSNQFKYFDGNDRTSESTYTYQLSSSLVGSDSLSGQLSRENGNVVGSYPFTIGTLAHSPDYYILTIDNSSTLYTITKRPITIYPTAGLSIVYGHSELSLELTYEAYPRSPLVIGTDPGLINNYPLSGKLTRANAGKKDVGDYHILLGTLSSSQYDIQLSSTPVIFKITKRPVEVTASATSQYFGEQEKNIQYTYTSGAPASGETLNGTLARANQHLIEVGTYSILANDITDPNKNPNYFVTFVSNTYSIIPRKITIVPNGAQSKHYKDSDPSVYTYTAISNYASDAIINGYPLVGSLTRQEGETFGSYPILQGTLSNSVGDPATNPNPNYEISFQTGVQFNILKKVAVITVHDSTIIEDQKRQVVFTYNANNQEIDCSHNNDELGDDAFNYSINNEFQNVGTYNVTINLAYTLNYTAASIKVVVIVQKYALPDIEKAEFSSTAKIYGENDPASFKVEKDGLGNDGKITATFEREAGENVGKYDFSAESITLSNNNYTIKFLDTDNIDAFEIKARELSIEPKSFEKIYGVADTVLQENIATSYFNDTLEIIYTRNAGENVGKYNLASISCSNTNYLVSMATDSNLNKFEIIRRNVKISAEPKSSFYGNAKVGLTYTITETDGSTGLVGSDTISGSLACNFKDSEAGTYVISKGSVDNENNPNYNIVFTSAYYEILQIEVTITPDEQTVEYGDPPAKLTFQISPSNALIEGQLAVTNSIDAGIHDITQGTIDNDEGRNRNYKITFVAGKKYTIKIRALVVNPTTTSVVYGEPHNIEYEIVSGSLLAGDTLAGNLSFNGSDNVGKYYVTLGTLDSANTNYNITLSSSPSPYEITKRNITVSAIAVQQEYGTNEKPLKYLITSGNLAYDDSLFGELTRENGYSVGAYAIIQGSLGNANYSITFVSANYEITKANLTIKIHDASSEYGESIVIDQSAYTITDGYVFHNDNLKITLSKDPLGSEMGRYDIVGTYDNDSYNITFINGIYTIEKWKSTIDIGNKIITIKYTGEAFKIKATVNSGADLIYNIGERKIENSFIEPGKYNVTLTADETSKYYAPEPVLVNLTILKDKLETANAGINVELTTDEGFDPDYKVVLSKNPKESPLINAALNKNQKLVRSYHVSIINTIDNNQVTEGKTKLRIQVPDSLKAKEAIKLIVFDDKDNYTYRTATIQNGYISIDVENVSNVVFIEETNSNILYYIIGGIAGLLFLIMTIFFIFKKRR